MTATTTLHEDAGASRTRIRRPTATNAVGAAARAVHCGPVPGSVNKHDTDGTAWFCRDCFAPEKHKCDQRLETKEAETTRKQKESRSRRRKEDNVPGVPRHDVRNDLSFKVGKHVSAMIIMHLEFMAEYLNLHRMQDDGRGDSEAAGKTRSRMEMLRLTIADHYSLIHSEYWDDAHFHGKDAFVFSWSNVILPAEMGKLDSIISIDQDTQAWIQ